MQPIASLLKKMQNSIQPVLQLFEATLQEPSLCKNNMQTAITHTKSDDQILLWDKKYTLHAHYVHIQNVDKNQSKKIPPQKQNHVLAHRARKLFWLLCWMLYASQNNDSQSVTKKDTLWSLIIGLQPFPSLISKLLSWLENWRLEISLTSCVCFGEMINSAPQRMFCSAAASFEGEEWKHLDQLNHLKLRAALESQKLWQRWYQISFSSRNGGSIPSANTLHCLRIHFQWRSQFFPWC